MEARSSHYLVHKRTLTVHYFELITLPAKISNTVTPLIKLNLFSHTIHNSDGSHEEGVGTIENLRKVKSDPDILDLLDCDVVTQIGYSSAYLDHHIGHALSSITLGYSCHDSEF